MSLTKPSDVTSVDDVELPCFKTPCVFVHARIPPVDTLGHKADAWNVANPDFICSLVCMTRGDLFIVRLLTEGEQIFAEAFWKPEKQMSSIIDAAVDSSRYFALRVENPETGSHVFIGIGFGERETAQNFKLTLSEHGRYLQRMRQAQQDSLSPTANPSKDNADASMVQTDSPHSSRLSTDSGRSGSPTAHGPQRDMTLQGTVRIELPNMCERRGLMAKGKGPAPHVLPLLLGGQNRGSLPPPPRVLTRDISGGRNMAVEDDLVGGVLSAPSSARSVSSVEMEGAQPPSLAAGEVHCSDGSSHLGKVVSTDGATDEDFGDFCGA